MYAKYALKVLKALGYLFWAAFAFVALLIVTDDLRNGFIVSEDFLLNLIYEPIWLSMLRFKSLELYLAAVVAFTIVMIFMVERILWVVEKLHTFLKKKANQYEQSRPKP